MQLYYADYAKLRDDFRTQTKSIDDEINDRSKEFIRALNSYQECNSNAWRIAFVTGVQELDERRIALDEYKREAIKSRAELNKSWLEQASAHNLTKIKPDEQITDFVLWYENYISLSLQGPLQELQIYSSALRTLSQVYGNMREACLNNEPTDTNFDTVEVTIRGLLSEVSSLLGMQ